MQNYWKYELLIYGLRLGLRLIEAVISVSLYDRVITVHLAEIRACFNKL